MYIHNFMVRVDHPTRYTKSIHTPTEVHCNTKSIPNTSPISINWIFFIVVKFQKNCSLVLHLYWEPSYIFDIFGMSGNIQTPSKMNHMYIYIYMIKWVYNFKFEIIFPTNVKTFFLIISFKSQYWWK